MANVSLPGTICINPSGHLEIGGCDVVGLANIYGTPLYVFDEKAIRRKCREYQKAFASSYPSYKVLYAGKAFSTMAVIRLMEQEGCGLDVVSGGELYTALAANFPVENIYFHGSNKSLEELNLALASGVGQIVVDNLWELENLSQLAENRKQKIKILLRLTPGIKAHTHHYIQTGQMDSKFGITITDGSAMVAVKKALQMPCLDLHGIHCHIGSQVHNLDFFNLAAGQMVEFLAQIKKETGYILKELNLGGGLGISYTAADSPRSITDYVQGLTAIVKRVCSEKNVPLPTLLVEPGRSLVGEAGIALYRVGAIKETSASIYASIDGGMADNPRPALYQAEYKVIAANKATMTPEQKYIIAGKCCESGDIVAKDVLMPKLVPGDLLAVLSSGAYHYAMASNYNRLPRPAVVMAADGKAEIIIRRETYSDLIRYDRIPASWDDKDFLPAVM